MTTKALKLLLITIVQLHCMSLMSQTPRCHYTAEDSATIVRLLNSGLSEPLDFARQFLGRPYVAHTLELYPDDERLVLNTRELDCTTFVDIVVALTICVKNGQTSFADYVRQLHNQRYWNGVCNAYPSRIHYFSDWIRDNSRMGFVSEVQQTIAPFTAVQHVSVSFMTSHPDKYVSLSRHPEYIPTIKEQEAALSGREYRYIPTAEVMRGGSALRQAVHDGDILAITSTARGLDIAHLGIAVWHGHVLHMIDASSRFHRVVEERESLASYLNRRADADGIRVVRIR